MFMAHAPPFPFLILISLPITGWLGSFIRENEAHFLLLNKEKAGCEVFLLSVFMLPDELPALPCPPPFISGASVAGGAGARGIKGSFITKRAPIPLPSAAARHEARTTPVPPVWSSDMCTTTAPETPEEGTAEALAEQLVFHMLTLWITHLASKNCIIVFFPNPFRNLVVVTSEAVFSSFLI